MLLLNSSVYRRSFLHVPIKKARKQLNKKKSAKRLYRRKKLLISIINCRQRIKRQFYNVNCDRKLIKRLKLQKRRNRRKKERPNITKKSRIDKRRLLSRYNTKKSGNYKSSLLPPPKWQRR